MQIKLNLSCRGLLACDCAGNGITARDGELLRRVATIERFFGKVKNLLTSPDWQTHVLEVSAASSSEGEIYGSRFPRGGDVVWLFINALPHNSTATVTLPASPRFVAVADCYSGATLPGQRHSGNVSVAIEASGIGCVYASAEPFDNQTKRFLGTMRNMTHGKPLQALSPAWHFLMQTLVSGASKPAAAADHDGMISIPGAPAYHFHVGEAPGSVFYGINAQDGYPPSPGAGEQWPWVSHIHNHPPAIACDFH
jgi:gamma-glutamyl hercynylcysteine S-oxide synthase